jgi:rRNA maturation RNase YbeY
LSIKIFYDDISFRYRGWRKFEQLLQELIRKENRQTGDLSIILTTDVNLRKINVEFLEHDYYTDVITFNYNEGDVINGEIYISIDTVKENSVNYNISFKNELTRVMIHGVLHLTGYNDKSDEEKLVMRNMEDFWLKFAEDI